MIRLNIPEPTIEFNLTGTVRYLSYAEVHAPWIPLSGGWLPVLENPVLFSLFGYTEGQQVIAGKDHFRLPNYNEGGGVDATFVRAWNSKNSSGRNTNKSPGTRVSGQIKAHYHSGSTSSGGNHSHNNASGSKLTASLGTVYLNAAGGQNSVRYGPATGTAGHSSHSHSGGSTYGTTIPTANDTGKVEPKGYGAVLCIHVG